ncbi:MAG TPA: DUF2207 domain-containing protein [Solirubrobacterales bacterium]|nr:DUF2207 domain-containing protein [Solirubrobacterales bacterium]
MKRVVLRLCGALLVIAVVAAVTAIAPAVPTSEKEYEITDATVSVELQDDGSLIVRESLPFDLTGSFSGAYRDIPLLPGVRITQAEVRDAQHGRYSPGANTALGSFDRPGSFGTEEMSDGYRIVWHYRAADETRTFDLVYRVTGAVKVYDDVVDVGWNVWGSQWDFWLDHLDADISAASGAAPEQAWVQPRSLGENVAIGTDAAVSIDRVPEGEAVGLHAIFPRDAIAGTGGAVVESGDGRAGIEQREAALDDGYGAVDKLKNFATDNALLLALLIGGAALAATAALCLLARERETGVPEYLPEPPEDVPPAVGYAIAKEGDYDERIVLATLMDLVDRGFYEARPAAGTDELDLEIGKGERPGGTAELEPYEKEVLDFFDELIGDEPVALAAMKDRIPEHSSTWRARWQSMNGSLEDAEDGAIDWDRDYRGRRALIALTAAILFGLVIVLVWSRTHRIGIPLTGLVATLLLMYVPPSNWLRRLEPAARERNQRWSGFAKWTEDFPRLDDDPPATLKLWRRILVYAIAFGTAERVAKSGRIPAPVAAEASSTGVWTSYAIASGSFGHGFDGFSSGFASQVAPESSSGSGGGGGGGGGGFSGGGGGGAW